MSSLKFILFLKNIYILKITDVFVIRSPYKFSLSQIFTQYWLKKYYHPNILANDIQTFLSNKIISYSELNIEKLVFRYLVK